ncbi:hypothetical protein [Streptomyces sp. TR02-1]|uniref:hypothetical protein n=1 Tax=Streptomyces sp. TR02-1 TaxID=3385977 RepID=UPI0039A1103C
MEFHSARALIDVLQKQLAIEEEARKRAGQENSAVDFDIRIAYEPATEATRKECTPVALKGPDGTLWITAFNADGEVPQVVEDDLGVSSEVLVDMDEIAEQARYS